MSEIGRLRGALLEVLLQPAFRAICGNPIFTPENIEPRSTTGGSRDRVTPPPERLITNETD